MIDSHTNLYGLLGQPVKHSLSPQMHNTMFEKLEMNARYVAFNVKSEQLEEAVKGIKALNIKGVNVTIPHKVKVMPHLDEISEEARQIGAVNTIVNQNGKLIGYNTDGQGYVRSLVEEMKCNLRGKRILIFGAGGAARAISMTLANHPIDKIVIVNRNKERAEELIASINKFNPSLSAFNIDFTDTKSYISESDLLINTTSIGMSPDIESTVIPADLIRDKHLVSDIVYNPIETCLLKLAKEKGARVHTGIGMFVYQGVIAFEKWTGITPDAKLMMKTVQKLLS